MDGTPTKQDLRTRMRLRLAGLEIEERTSLSIATCARLVDSVLGRGCRTLMVYLAMPDEIDLSACITRCLEGGVHVCVPRIDWDRKELTPVTITSLDAIRTGRHGVPIPPAEAPIAPAPDVVLVPGLAFDERCQRLGRGAGFYDRFLADLPARAVGVAFDFQIVASLPTDEWDIPLDAVATPSRWIE